MKDAEMQRIIEQIIQPSMDRLICTAMELGETVIRTRELLDDTKESQ